MEKETEKKMEDLVQAAEAGWLPRLVRLFVRIYLKTVVCVALLVASPLIVIMIMGALCDKLLTPLSYRLEDYICSVWKKYSPNT